MDGSMMLPVTYHDSMPTWFNNAWNTCAYPEQTMYASSVPATGIPVKGTNELVIYLAANLLAGNRRINVAHYVGADNSDHSDTLQQASQEAGGSPRDKVTYFHNKIINSFRYDHAVYKDSTSNIDARTEYTARMPEITFAGNESVSYVRLAMRPWSNGTIRNSVPAGPDWESSHVTSTAVQPSPVLTTFHACRLL